MRISLNAGIMPGGRQVRAAAEVLPLPLTALGVDVLVDGQLGAADLHDVLVDGTPPLRPMSSSLYGSSASSARASLLGDDPASEPLTGLDDLLHALLEALEVLGRERRLDVEVVVEAVLDGRPDAELGVLEGVLHRLREHVGARVAQHGEAVVGVDGDRLDVVTVVEHLGEVAQLAVDRATTTERSSANRSAAVVPDATCGASPATVMERSDTESSSWCLMCQWLVYRWRGAVPIVSSPVDQVSRATRAVATGAPPASATGRRRR